MNAIPQHSLPYLTSPDLSVAGRLKVRPEDFVVDEIPSYLPSGEGHHLFLHIEKRDCSTEFLVGHLARTLKIRREEVGVAGLKDRWAVTRQWVSVPVEVADNVEAINSDLVTLLEFGLHRNKLKTGHLRGNRFRILVRDVAPEALATAQQLAELVRARGVPNYFGEQRFGVDGETLQLGLSLLKGDASPTEIPAQRRKFLTRLALSAAQSSLFNTVLTRRLAAGTLDRIQPGDVMQKRDSGGLFVAQDIAVEQPRFDAGETVITGPIFGPKMKLPEGEVQALEQAVLLEAGLTRAVFFTHRQLTPGTRRQLLTWPENLTVAEHPDGLEFSFTLDSGCYATMVMREFLKGAESAEPPRNFAPTGDQHERRSETPPD